VAVPVVGGLAQRMGPQRLLPALVAMSLAGCLLTLVDSLPVVVAGLGLMAFAMFSTVTTCQLLIPRLVDHHRGTATSLHLTLYYLGGALGAYLPGLWLDGRDQAWLVRGARRYVGSRAVAEDEVGETWLGVLRGIDGFQGGSSLRTWIFRILTNTAKTRAQRERRSIPFASPGDGDDG